ncbi:hypothetical protein E0K83_03800 [Gramella sp. BOM4]|nr:hypothetical protein [Christiangramia bathymodioli]
MNNQKIHLKKLDQEDLAALNEAAHAYAPYLRHLAREQQTAQPQIHLSILMAYGYEVFKKLHNHNKESGLKLEIFMAFIALDSLHYYLETTEDKLHAAKCSRMIEELDALLPNVIDRKVYTVNSKMN